MKREQIDEIRTRVNLVDVISRYVGLKQTGSSYKGICPFHEDTDPSLTVDPDKQLWYCFGCGEGGDVFKFLMEIENLSFPEAAAELGREVGIEPQDKSGSKAGSRLEKLNEEVAEYFHKNLLRKGVGRKARNYLDRRGYGEEVIRRFQLGFSLPEWQSLTNKFGAKYSKELLKKGGLIKESKGGRIYDRFRGRLMFPIKTPTGKTIAFGGRKLEPSQKGPKYLNSPNTPLFHKGSTLYGLDIARPEITKSGQAILVEGYTDTIAPQSKGIANTVASLGTSLTEDQARLLQRFAEEIVIAYDRDQAGEAATLKGMRLLRNQGLRVKIANLPPDKDPADLIEEGGIQPLKTAIEEAIPFYKFYLEVLENRHDLNTVEGRERALNQSVDFLRNLESPPLRSELIGELKDMLQVPEEELERRSQPSAELSPPDRPEIQHTQQDLSPDEWLIHLLIEDRIPLEQVHQAGIIDELEEGYRQIVQKLDRSEGDSLELQKLLRELDEAKSNRLARISMADISRDPKLVEKIFSDVVKKLKIRKRKKKKATLKAKLQNLLEEGASREKLERVQSEILKQTKKLQEEVD
ncbi:MAG: DNA primase [Candidatus Acetothermia bacterium]